MAYTLEQKRYFARELARSGGNVPAAVERLRNEYEDMRGIGESTLRRFMLDAGSAEMIAREAAIQSKAAGEASAEAERDKIRRELLGSEFDRLARDEALLDDMRGLVGTALDECKKAGADAKLPIAQIASLYERMTRVSDARRMRTIPVISTTENFSLAFRIFGEEALTEMKGRAAGFMGRVRDRIAEALRKKDDAVSGQTGAGETPAVQ